MAVAGSREFQTQAIQDMMITQPVAAGGLAAFLLFFSAIPGLAGIEVAKADGFAAANGGTTGGGAVVPIQVSTWEAFRQAVSGDEPAVVVVEGRIEVGSVRIGSNKTIIGASTSAGLHGRGIGLQGKNVILQNLTLGPAPGDVLELSGAHNVFITKCEFFGSSDELCSIVRGSDFVTVSWSKFHFPEPDSHSFPHLIGNSDNRTSDRGKLHVTMHHNLYLEGCRSRMPRVRFGKVHLYNNYYRCEGNNYCIGTGVESSIRVENSVFDGVNRPWNDMGGMAREARIGWRNLRFIDSAEPDYAPNRWPVFDLPYDHQPDSLDEVRKLLVDAEFGAGNCLSR